MILRRTSASFIRVSFSFCQLHTSAILSYCIHYNDAATWNLRMSTSCRRSVSFISVLLPLASSYICVRSITGVLPCVVHQCRSSVWFISVSCASRQLIYRCTHHNMHINLCRTAASFISVSFLFHKLVYMCTQHCMPNYFMSYTSVIHPCVVLLLPIYIHIYMCIHNTVCILLCVVHQCRSSVCLSSFANSYICVHKAIWILFCVVHQRRSSECFSPFVSSRRAQFSVTVYTIMIQRPGIRECLHCTVGQCHSSMMRRGGGLGSSTIFKKFNEPYAPS